MQIQLTLSYVKPEIEIPNTRKKKRERGRESGSGIGGREGGKGGHTDAGRKFCVTVCFIKIRCSVTGFRSGCI